MSRQQIPSKIRRMTANPFKNSANDSKSLQKKRWMIANPSKNSANDSKSLQKISEWSQIPSKIRQMIANPLKNSANDSKSLKKTANDSKSIQKLGKLIYYHILSDIWSYILSYIADFFQGFAIIRQTFEGICCHSPNFWRDLLSFAEFLKAFAIIRRIHEGICCPSSIFWRDCTNWFS